ncbi:LOW QUALITY PROTEIN: hypothetical protein PanWU01x14_047400 [Parasponia andersonii]|uniref:LRR domain containing protein n=1 Tax=Parasponia andersonii TaxID=3476 RepID=A0A2P5DN17_PARAD|nr:LOW QUALITY PROTEIN: hypothetical protein PanWU01x14_047400 [Parasponia andersonii]
MFAYNSLFCLAYIKQYEYYSHLLCYKLCFSQFYDGQALIFPMNMRENCCSLWPNLKHLKVMTYCDLMKESELREALCWVSPSLKTLVVEKKKEGYY